MTADLNNLVQAIGELNGDRSNFRFGMIKGEPRKYGACDFEVDFKGRVVEPTPSIRSDIARICRYMEDTYRVPIGKKQRQLFDLWNMQDPLSESEKCKSALIESIFNGK